MNKRFWIITAGVAGCLVALVWFIYFLTLSPVGTGKSKQFTIQPGASITSIAKNLQQEGLIKSVGGFKFYLKLTGKVIVQPGAYEISPNFSAPRIANLVANGNTANSTIVIPEGYTLDQISTLMAEKGIATKSEFQTAAENFPPDYGFMKSKPTTSSLEGFLFPDTYRLLKGDAVSAIRMMLNNFETKYKSDIAPTLGDRNFYNILIVASLIEREAKAQTDREQISAVLYNRLAEGMRLDVDATVRYLTGNWKDPITKTDLAIKSPYNTRLHAGLPPGPICNPGLASIKAAMDPPDSDYYYYLTDFEGITHYAKTLQEHNENKLRYLL